VRSLRTEAGKGSVPTAVEHGLAGPEVQVKRCN
jgi:hypothetical protein